MEKQLEEYISKNHAIVMLEKIKERVEDIETKAFIEGMLESLNE